MAKAIKAKIRLHVAGGAATPAPPVGSALGQHGVNIMDFCKQFNARTADKKGQTVPVVITVYVDKKFDFIVKSAPTSELIKKKAKVEKGSGRPHDKKVATLSWADIEEIAKIKLNDLNAASVEEAKKTVAGTARSMGITVE